MPDEEDDVNAPAPTPTPVPAPDPKVPWRLTVNDRRLLRALRIDPEQ
jgi:hypothetical protein